MKPQTQQIPQLWHLLNRLNQQTKTYDGYLSPFERQTRDPLVLIMKNVYADADLDKIQNEDVAFLKETLSLMRPHLKHCDYQDPYGRDSKEHEHRRKISAIIGQAHSLAPSGLSVE